MVHDLSDRTDVVFDDERVVVNAGVMLAVTLGKRLGIEALVDRAVRLGDRPGAFRPGRKLLSLVHAMLLGADSIDDCELLRAGSTEALLGHRAMAPSTLGSFLRSFSFGHVRQLDRVLATVLGRAWQAGAGPGKRRLVVDVDSFVGEVHGHAKQGAGYGYTGALGYVEALTGLTPGREGKVSCPFHEDHTPSLHVYRGAERGWWCYSCERGTSVYDLAAALWGLAPRGETFLELRRRLYELLLPGTPVPGPPRRERVRG